MRSIRMFLVLTLLCGVWILHGKTEALPPRLEIVSAIYGTGPEAVDITDKVRKEIKAGSYLEFRNNPRFTGKNFRDRKADKNIRIVYKLGGKKEEATFKNNALVFLGRLPEKFQFGTPEWIQHFADFSGGALVLMFSVLLRRHSFPHKTYILVTGESIKSSKSQRAKVVANRNIFRGCKICRVIYTLLCWRS